MASIGFPPVGTIEGCTRRTLTANTYDRYSECGDPRVKTYLPSPSSKSSRKARTRHLCPPTTVRIARPYPLITYKPYGRYPVALRGYISFYQVDLCGYAEVQDAVARIIESRE